MRILCLISFFALSTCLFGQSDSLHAAFYEGDYNPPEVNQITFDKLDSTYRDYVSRNKVTSENRMATRDFVYKANFSMERLNHSGKILYDNEIERYLNGLKDTLLSGMAEKDGIHIYVTRNSSLNAFTNDFGSVYVNLATVAKLKNEEELLGVLAHEIAHVLLKHSAELDKFKDLEQENLKSKKEVKGLETHLFNQEQEHAADQKGFELLQKLGVDLNKAFRLFDRLDQGRNPALSGPIEVDLLTFGDTFSTDYLKSLYKQMSISPTVLENREEFDSLGTHPEIASRKEKTKHWISTQNNTSVLYNPTGQFEGFQTQAQFLLINSLRTSGKYLEGLYLTLRMQEKFNDNHFLIKSQAKFLTLLAQDKYKSSAFDQFVNYRGQNSDLEYLKFKKLMLSLNPLEFNLLAVLALQSIDTMQDGHYFGKLNRFQLSILYRNNPDLFTMGEDGLTYIDPNSKNYDSLQVFEFSHDLFLDTKQLEIMDSLKKLNYDFVPVRIKSECNELIIHFLNTQELGTSGRESIDDYKMKRDLYEQSLSFSKFYAPMDPVRAYKFFEDGQTFDFDKLMWPYQTAYVQVSSLVVSDLNEDEQFELDAYQSLLMEREMIEIINKKRKFGDNYSNLTLKPLSKTNLHYQFILMNWIDERFELNEFSYSRVDEEIEQIYVKENIHYLVYSMNVSCRNQKKGPKTINFTYEYVFDIEKEGIILVNKISSKEKKRKKAFYELYNKTDINTQ